ncbi:hypothetical protein LTR62_007807 [Meristemomyces frigidus]|uniref:Uncharacterized protein n=1 Tax=Meristemomyces frigidus TaxID=1508187 RepID=A0AAN7TA77_9PEZI|nr:hypothetical protein LTR62_007807 [Meristemomyces frigidus]
MATLIPSIPRGTFNLTSKQLRRHVSTTPNLTTTPTNQLSLFKPPTSIIKPWKLIPSAREWQTSTYHYNKATQKTLPTTTATASKLLTDYATMIKSRGLGSTGSSSTARSAVAARRRNFEKTYVSEVGVKDYGDRVVVTGFVYDAAEAEKEERLRRAAEMKEKMAARGRAKKRRGPASGGAGGAGGVRRPYGASAGAAGGVRRLGGAAGGAAGGFRRPAGDGAGAAGGFRRLAPAGFQRPAGGASRTS